MYLIPFASLLASLSLFSSTATADVALQPGERSPRVSIIYSSTTNHTKTLALAIADGVASKGGDVCVLSVNQANFHDDVLTWADAVLLGTPTYFGNPASDMLAWIETEWERYWMDEKMGEKLGGVFATGGGIGQGVEDVLASLTRLLWSFRVRVLTPSPIPSGYSSYGAIGITGTPPFNSSDGSLAEGFITAAQEFGEMVAERTAAQIGQ